MPLLVKTESGSTYRMEPTKQFWYWLSNHPMAGIVIGNPLKGKSMQMMALMLEGQSLVLKQLSSTKVTHVEWIKP